MAWLPEAGRTDEAWALHDAREAFAAGRIDVDELERRIDLALTAPPKRPRDPTNVECM